MMIRVKKVWARAGTQKDAEKAITKNPDARKVQTVLLSSNLSKSYVVILQ